MYNIYGASIPTITVSTTNTTNRTVSVPFSGSDPNCFYSASVFAAGKNSGAIGSGSKTGVSPITINYNHSAVLTHLDGASSRGWHVKIEEYSSYQAFLDGAAPTATTASTVTAITVSVRHTAVSHSNAPYNLDVGGQIQVSWTRPSTHSIWRTRLQFVIDDVVTFTRSGYTGGGPLNFTPTAEEALALQNAMGGVSPKTMVVRCITGIALSSTEYLSGYISSSQTNNLIKLFSAIKVRLGTSWLTKTVKVWRTTLWKSAIVKVWTGSAWKQAK